MGITPIPIVPRPPLSKEEQFRREITPRRTHGDEFLNIAIVALILALVLLPLVWWVAA